MYHFAAPARLALSSGKDPEDTIETAERSDFGKCVLLDHIPHGDDGLPKNITYGDDATYVQYAITVIIPDVECDR